jgi:hypothetical protein
MKIKDHWCVVSGFGEIAGLSIVDEHGAWADATSVTEWDRGELEERGYTCVKCKIEDASE